MSIRAGGSELSRVISAGAMPRVVVAGETLWAPYSITVPTNPIYGSETPPFLGSLTSSTISIPATDKQAGDLILAFCSTDGNKVLSPSAGWTTLGALTGDPTCYVFARYWSGTSTINLTVSWSGSEDFAYATLHLRDATRELSEIQLFGPISTGSGSPVDVPTFTPSRADEYMWVAAIGMSSGYITAAPEGWGGASGASGTSAANAGVGYVMKKERASSMGVTGVELSGSASWRAAMMAVPPRKS